MHDGVKERHPHSIVTGASGFIGIALCRELLGQGVQVTALVRPGSENKRKLEQLMQEKEENQKRLTVLEMGLDKLQELWSLHRIQADVFYHLAWNGAAGAKRNDFDVQCTNISYTAGAIRAAKLCGCAKFVGAGSQAEYGVIRGKAKEEETVPYPFLMYGAAKLAAYMMGRVLAEQSEIAFVWPRIYSIYGVGENPGTLVNYVMGMLKGGNVPELTACKNMWNFMYITDCARALCLLGETEGTNGIYHVASKDSRLLKDFVEEIRDIVSPESELGFGKKAGDPEKTFWLEPDVGRLEEIGFQCEVGFEDGIRRKLREWL